MTCVHYCDSNGHVGRPWHTLLLSKWNLAFARLLVESMIHDRQQEYYEAINAANDAGESTAFIEFMLPTIQALLIDAIKTSDEMSDGKIDKAAARWKLIEEFLQTHNYIMNADIWALCGVSAATANRILAEYIAANRLTKSFISGHWGYKIEPTIKLIVYRRIYFMNIIYLVEKPDKIKPEVKKQIEDFFDGFNPLEGSLYIFEDKITKAIYCECHILANTIIEKGTIDSPLDADGQSEYRANRDIVEDSTAFLQMKNDALKKRSFSNIVAEYNTSFDKTHPLKIIGGQHRFTAILEALSEGISQPHGLKVYFDLNTDQRLDVQLISNTNIAVSSDLLDRMLETVKGPELRTWCQSAGLLNKHEDFAD